MGAAIFWHLDIKAEMIISTAELFCLELSVI